MNLKPTLTKENFFNEMTAKYPKAMANFYKWIDEYKEAVNWDRLFNAGYLTCMRAHDGNGYDTTGNTYAPKFHDLPYAIQYGIWIEYCRQELSNYFEQPEHISDTVDLREDIEGVFKEAEDLIEYN